MSCIYRGSSDIQTVQNWIVLFWLWRNGASFNVTAGESSCRNSQITSGLPNALSANFLMSVKREFCSWIWELQKCIIRWITLIWVTFSIDTLDFIFHEFWSQIFFFPSSHTEIQTHSTSFKSPSIYWSYQCHSCGWMMARMAEVDPPQGPKRSSCFSLDLNQNQIQLASYE